MNRHSGTSFSTKCPSGFFSWKKKKNMSVLLMVPPSRMNPSCVILIRGNHGKQNYLLHPMLYMNHNGSSFCTSASAVSYFNMSSQ